MNRKAFELALTGDGFENVGLKEMEPNCHNDAHAHDFDVRAMVVEGDITLTVDGKKRKYSPGDIIEMERGCMHIEDVGDQGMKFVVGRRA
ncbi:cupin domain-containing protein [Minwuia sp.]|uniref:cupin domain-containing protein n=1 Tax=Minwuia sp. TaxID=2493630 RepID=UPI003A924FCA